MPNFFVRVWRRADPYLERLLTDTLVSASLYVVLYLFHVLATYLPVPGWAGEFIENLHAVGIVLALACFAVLFILDIIEIATERKDEPKS